MGGRHTTLTTSPGSGSATTTTAAGCPRPGNTCAPPRSPFGEQAWNHARQLLAARGSDPATEAEIAAAAADLLDRAGKGPAPPDEPAPRRSRTSRQAARAIGRARGGSGDGPQPPRPRSGPARTAAPDGDRGQAEARPGRTRRGPARGRDRLGAGDPAAVVRRAQGGREMVVADSGLLENRRAPATTLEGWRSFDQRRPLRAGPAARLNVGGRWASGTAGTTTRPGSRITPSWSWSPPRRSPRSPARGRCWC